MLGENNSVPRVSLDPGMIGKSTWQQNAITAPASKTTTPTVPKPSAVSSTPTSLAPVSSASQPHSSNPPAAPTNPTSTENKGPVTSTSQDILSEQLASTTISSTTVKEESPSTPLSKEAPPPPSQPSRGPTASVAASRISSQKTSKFRFLTFKPYHISEHFDNISGLSINTSPECNLIEVLFHVSLMSPQSSPAC